MELFQFKKVKNNYKNQSGCNKITYKHVQSKPKQHRINGGTKFFGFSILKKILIIF